MDNIHPKICSDPLNSLDYYHMGVIHKVCYAILFPSHERSRGLAALSRFGSMSDCK